VDAKATHTDSKGVPYLTCERWSVFFLLMVTAGIYGAYTFILRGGVFSNAQTGNLLQTGIYLAQGAWKKAAYYLIPFAGYVFGTLLSEWLPTPLKKRMAIRWDTLLVFIEIAVVIVLGFLPLSLPCQIAQLAINCLYAMQFNTFRQMEGIPMATTFCTNHVRQFGISLTKWIRKRDTQWAVRMWKHLSLLLAFIAGVTISTLACRFLGGYAILTALVPLGIVGARLLYADLKTEKDYLPLSPHGH